MAIWCKEGELENLRSRLGDGKLHALWLGLRERALAQAAYPGLMQPEDTQMWWHLVWERLSDVAFLQAMEPTPALGRWLKAVTLEIARKPLDEWIGPWFRPRLEPVQGHLETAHVGLALATVVDLCPDLFDGHEIAEIKEALAAKCQIPCRNWLDARLNPLQPTQNWFMVLLNGYGTVSAVLDDREGVAYAVRGFGVAAQLYNQDSYGESLQYWNYASLHLSHLYEVLVRYDESLAEALDLGCYARCIPWAAQSLMYLKPLAGWGEEARPRSANFGDSAALFRPTGDLLLHVANRARDRYPREAGLARWLFETTYAHVKADLPHGASFGFLNTYQFPALLLYADAAGPLSPGQADLPLTAAFETGDVIVRDRWDGPRTVLAVHGGYQPLNCTTGHRHLDQNSFILAHLQERFFADAGHCCYRLMTQAFSKSTKSHNTWIFQEADKGERERIQQRPVQGSALEPIAPLNRLLLAKHLDDISVIRSDAALAYGDPIQQAERTWILAGPHALFIVDRIGASKPIQVEATFLLNNRDNRLKYNIASETRLVFRRNGAAIKFFLVRCRSDETESPAGLTFSWGYMHDCYHPLPNQKGQGAEGSGMFFTYTTQKACESHLMVYAIAMDALDPIVKWHIRDLGEEGIYVEPPAKVGGYSMRFLGDGGLSILDHDTRKTYLVTSDNRLLFGE